MTTDQEPAWVADVLSFWFEELKPADWFEKNEAVDARITERFAALYGRLRQIAVDQLATSSRTALAAVIVLDQFPRNILRGRPEAFASDRHALSVAQIAVAKGYDKDLTKDEAVFLYLPYEHSEDLAVQDRAVALISALGDERYAQYAEAHRDVIREFGRFPHRNAVLGRQSTPEEEAYLAKPDSGF